MRWIKLFEEFSDTERLSPANLIYLKFLIESFLEGFERVDKKSNIDIVKKKSWKLFGSSVVSSLQFHVDVDGKKAEIIAFRLEIFKYFESYLKENIGNNYKSILRYKQEVEIKYSSRREVIPRMNLTRVYKLSLVRYLLFVRFIEKFLTEFKNNSWQLVNHSIFSNLTEY
jgi:hypothetical protein